MFSIEACIGEQYNSSADGSNMFGCLPKREWKAIDNKEEEIEAESAGFWKSVYAMKRNNETGRAIESLAKIYWEIGQLEKSKALFLELLHRNQELWPEGTDGHRTTRKLPEGGTSTTIHHSDQRSVSVTQANLNRLREEIRSQ